MVFLKERTLFENQLKNICDFGKAFYHDRL